MFLLATVVLWTGVLTVRLAASPIARFITGVDCLIFARPASSALVVDSSTTSAAATAAAPSASPAIDVTPLTLRCAAFVITSLAFVVMLLTIETSLLGKPLIIRMGAARFQDEIIIKVAHHLSESRLSLSFRSSQNSSETVGCRTPPIKCGPKPAVSVHPQVADRRLARPPFTRTRGSRGSEKSSHPTPAAMRRHATGLLRAWRANTGRTSSAPHARGLTPQNLGA